ncbi:hypothetical protein [Bifidobacterium phasiani]|uniref:Uncharacterized protein n=1 Tax=Bifidobacterium phasiani TaxID=2834431 RepID=A0ABS6WBE9_9BIFI|nr:hypothetical protein [Bifidobacterium phasiani]MBW3083742.1 hypothetical protein [Bifidobacterium phasiani]
MELEVVVLYMAVRLVVDQRGSGNREQGYNSIRNRVSDRCHGGAGAVCVVVSENMGCEINDHPYGSTYSASDCHVDFQWIFQSLSCLHLFHSSASDYVDMQVRQISEKAIANTKLGWAADSHMQYFC